MSMYSQFKTDTEMETKGIALEYGDFRIMIARAGGANKKFSRVLEQRTKPYRRAMKTETMDNDLAVELLYEVYAEAIVLDWLTKVDGEFKKGIENPDGPKLLPPTVENIVATFRGLPDLFLDVQEQAQKVALFRQDILEADAGN